MNKARRNVLKDAVKTLHEVVGKVSDAKIDEEEAFDNLPESLQESDRGDEMQEIIDNLDTALDSLAEAMEYIEDCL